MKFLLIALSIWSLLLLRNCTTTKPNPKSNEMIQEKLTENQKKIEANKELVKLWIMEGWNNNKNSEVVSQVFAQNWIDGNPSFPDQPKGIEGAMYFVDQYRKALKDIKFEITHLIADSDYVTFRFKADAIHSDSLLGVPATGKNVTITGIVIHKVENGRFAMSWNEIDLLGLKMQLESK